MPKIIADIYKLIYYKYNRYKSFLVLSVNLISQIFYSYQRDNIFTLNFKCFELLDIG